MLELRCGAFGRIERRRGGGGRWPGASEPCGVPNCRVGALVVNVLAGLDTAFTGAKPPGLAAGTGIAEVAKWLDCWGNAAWGDQPLGGFPPTG